MISDIEFIPFPKKESFHNDFRYIEELPYFKKNKMMSFKPGVNVIFGQNGTGKSTILSMLALALAAKQGGVSKITHDWKYSFYKDGYKVSHDGQPILYCDTKTDVGLIGGMAGFDNDFFDEGLMAAQRKVSSGLTTLSRLNKIMDVLLKDKPMPDTIIDNDDDIIGNIEKGQKTIIIDEPESGLSYIVQSNLIPKIVSNAKKHNLQIIIASHSPFFLKYPKDEVNLIEMEDNFIFNTKVALLELSDIRKYL